MIRATAELGASYPEVVQLLVQASRQGNLPGRFEQNALPKAGRRFLRLETDGDAGGKARIGSEKTAPNLFSTRDKDSD